MAKQHLTEEKADTISGFFYNAACVTSGVVASLGAVMATTGFCKEYAEDELNNFVNSFENNAPEILSVFIKDVSSTPYQQNISYGCALLVLGSISLIGLKNMPR